jgi:ATP-dependent Clp protease ATP-binding subunit ClpX
MSVLWKEKPELTCWLLESMHICDKCIEQAHGIVLEELKSSGSSKFRWSDFEKPKEIRAF